MSINIEEERVAFLIHNPPAICLRLIGMKFEPSCETIYQQEVCKIANIRWESWLAAKAHSAEMAKQEVEFQESIYGCSVYAMRNGQRSFTASMEHSSKEDAVQWAKVNGYRVIEE